MVALFVLLAVVVAAALLFVPGGALVIGYTLAALSLGLIGLLMGRALYRAIDDWRLGRFSSPARPAERRDAEDVETRDVA